MEDKPTEELVQILGGAAQVLTKRVKENPGLLNVPFPRGHIRTLNACRDRWPYLPKDEVRTLSCILQLCDINQWHLNTWKISLTAGTVWEWQCSLPIVAVMESITYGFGLKFGLIKEGTKFSKVINKLHNAKIYKNQLRGELITHKNRRNEIHLFLKNYVDHHDGKPRRYNQTIRTLHKLEARLLDEWNKRNT